MADLACRPACSGAIRQTGWASYDKSFAALFVICFIFTLVTNGLERIKRYLLRWQNGAEK